MYEQVKELKTNKSRAVANSATQKKSNVKQSFGFVDNRHEAITQRKLHGKVDEFAAHQPELNISKREVNQLKLGRHLNGCGCSTCTGNIRSESQKQSTIQRCAKCNDEKCKGNPCKIDQELAGLHTSRAFDQFGISVGRRPHTTGGVATAGSGRAEIHDRGNRQAIVAAKNRAIQEGVVTSTDFQSSQVRARVSAERRIEKLKEKEAKDSGERDEAEFEASRLRAQREQEAASARAREHEKTERDKKAESQARKAAARQREANRAKEAAAAEEYAKTPAGKAKAEKEAKKKKKQ